MRGRKRIRKKRINQGGWRVVSEGRGEGKGYHVVLQHESGEQVAATAGTRAHARYSAEKEVRDRERARVEPHHLLPDRP